MDLFDIVVALVAGWVVLALALTVALGRSASRLSGFRVEATLLEAPRRLVLVERPAA